MYIEAYNFDPDRLLVNMIYFFIYLPNLLNVKSLGFVLELFQRQILKYCFFKNNTFFSNICFPLELLKMVLEGTLAISSMENMALTGVIPFPNSLSLAQDSQITFPKLATKVFPYLATSSS